jgi:H+-translocating NAD(P) transhydrogenase subunit beta
MLTMIPQLIIGLVDLTAAFLFMYGLQRMSSPATAPSGILVAGVGMLAAVLASFLYIFSVSAAAAPHLFVNVGLALIALIVGGGVAWWSGKKVAMTAMPQMVALYNGMGGGAAGAIAAVELFGGKSQGVTQLAKKVYVVKRGQGKGYAGIVNALFDGDNCNMVYGDAQAVLVQMIEAVRGLGTAAAA